MVWEVFNFITQSGWKKDISTLKSWHFEASENIITKFKSQGLYTMKIKYWNASGSGFPPFLIPALQNIGILLHKKEKLRILLQQSVCQGTSEYIISKCSNFKSELPVGAYSSDSLLLLYVGEIQWW